MHRVRSCLDYDTPTSDAFLQVLSELAHDAFLEVRGKSATPTASSVGVPIGLLVSAPKARRKPASHGDAHVMAMSSAANNARVSAWM